MADAHLRELERAAAQGGPVERFRFRPECVRRAESRRAGIEPGDVVEVRERESRWARGRWTGVVVERHEDGHAYVVPDDPSALRWCVATLRMYAADGLYLTKKDRITLLAPHAPDASPPRRWDSLRAIACPKCGAPRGAPCVKLGGKFHAARRDAGAAWVTEDDADAEG